MPAKDGAAFLERLKKLQSEIWFDGTQITGDICEHSAFKGVIQSKAKLFDLQVSKENIELMTYTSPLTGDRVGSSYLRPTSKEDLEKRRLTTQKWAKTSAGMLGRSPDYMNTGIMALAAAADVFQDTHCRGDNLKKFYEHVRENDLTLAHTFVTPQVNRSLLYYEDNDVPISARVVKETEEGLIIKGARLLVTQGGITDELLVLPVGGNNIEEAYLFAFSIPSNTKNLKFICRESFAYRSSNFDHPLGSRFEEMDAIVVFDNVLVPWERVFLYKDYSIAYSFQQETHITTFLLHQTVARQVIKIEFILGAAQLIIESINISGYQHVQDKLCEIISGLETLKALLISSELSARQDNRGTMIPDANPLLVAVTTFSQLYPRCIEILQMLGASGLISIPTEENFSSDITPHLEQYLQGASCNAHERTKIFRLAWDACMSAFGGRQVLYERFFFGDPVRLRAGIYNNYNKDKAVELAKSFLN
ncbi:4-hydroxyphenylacetate 3-monooxygenase, oxygenase component [Bacillus sp. HMF5848]|uniref:4-hydroxyphenylacetate 3-monooxygenase, oxygenase component n=1 Tax=Bacillus sp. HMF5848 TaxID=2495421 RepID=UPI000F7780D4|nr:4-hydroxyphenylacetate 3-monooxygenase, oxygenase component [Bacillus sp. HMF5848]RSK28540.1 4-hydroxyphenylacetate 3-monooxygenase, oxygenase component [Bacillus sp. HMF5848]